jgi:TPR repeat protein
MSSMNVRLSLIAVGSIFLSACAGMTASTQPSESTSIDVNEIRALALRHLQGSDIDRDPIQAVKLYTQAAFLGDSASQAALGQSYERGIGVKKDIVTAFAWYQLSADQQDDDGNIGIARLRPQLSQAQWNAAQELHDLFAAAVMP